MAYDSSNYLMQRTSSAAQGAAAGAALGSAASPLGSLIGAGVGGLAGFAMGGPSEAQKLRDEQLAEYRRRQEMGLLGLTDEELAVLRAQMVDPMLAQQRQFAAAQAAGMGMMGAGAAGLTAKTAIAMEAEKARQRQVAQQQLAQAHLQKQIAEEALMEEMIASKEQEIQKSKQEALAAAPGLATTLGTAATDLGEAKILKEQEAQMAQMAQDQDAFQKTMDLPGPQDLDEVIATYEAAKSTMRPELQAQWDEWIAQQQAAINQPASTQDQYASYWKDEGFKPSAAERGLDQFFLGENTAPGAIQGQDLVYLQSLAAELGIPVETLMRSMTYQGTMGAANPNAISQDWGAY